MIGLTAVHSSIAGESSWAESSQTLANSKLSKSTWEYLWELADMAQNIHQSGFKIW